MSVLTAQIDSRPRLQSHVTAGERAMTTPAWYIGSDNEIQVEDLKDARDGTAITDATITAQLKDSDDANVGSSITLTYDSDEASYFGVIPNATTSGLTEGAQYTLEITITKDALQDIRKITRVAKYRGPDA